MDLENLDTQKASGNAQKCHLEHPSTGEALFSDGKPMTISVLGKHSKEFDRAMNAISERIAGRRKKISAHQAKANAVELLAAVTVGWDNITLGGENLEFSKANVKMVYTRFHWIRDQVDEFVGEIGNFMETAPNA